MWEKKVKHNKVFYRLNDAHPAVASLLRTARKHGIGQEVGNFLRIIEETIPVPLILIDGSEQPESIGDPSAKKAPSEIHQYFRSLHAAMCDAGQDAEEAFDLLAATEPFHRYPELLAAFKEHEHIGE